MNQPPEKKEVKEALDKAKGLNNGKKISKKS